MGNKGFSTEDITDIIQRTAKVNMQDMSLKDQMIYALNVAKFAEAMQPIVDKYVPKKIDDVSEADLFKELSDYFKLSDEGDEHGKD